MEGPVLELQDLDAVDGFDRGTDLLLVRLGYPVDDRGGYVEGDPLAPQKLAVDGSFSVSSIRTAISSTPLWRTFPTIDYAM